MTTSATSDGIPKRTLMDIPRSECFVPSQKQIHLADKINTYLIMFKSSKAEELNQINEILKADWQPMPTIAYNCLLKPFPTKCSAFQNQFVTDAMKLYRKITDYLWYIFTACQKVKDTRLSSSTVF